MSAARTVPWPHERRVQKYAYAALAAAAGLGAALALTSDATLLRIALPTYVPLVLIGLGAILGVAAISRRSSPLVLGAAVVLALGVLPAGSPGLGAYALGLLFGLALLLALELVHMMERYERAHRSVEDSNVPEDHINRVTDEALRTLATRSGAAAIAAACAIGLAFLLATLGPAKWRAAVETSAPVGVAVLALAIAGAVSLFILARGATFRLRREATPKELLPDVAE
jgi:hypothetical protein